MATPIGTFQSYNDAISCNESTKKHHCTNLSAAVMTI